MKSWNRTMKTAPSRVLYMRCSSQGVCGRLEKRLKADAHMLIQWHILRVTPRPPQSSWASSIHRRWLCLHGRQNKDIPLLCRWWTGIFFHIVLFFMWINSFYLPQLMHKHISNVLIMVVSDGKKTKLSKYYYFTNVKLYFSPIVF